MSTSTTTVQRERKKRSDSTLWKRLALYMLLFSCVLVVLLLPSTAMESRWSAELKTWQLRVANLAHEQSTLKENFETEVTKFENQTLLLVDKHLQLEKRSEKCLSTCSRLRKEMRSLVSKVNQGERLNRQTSENLTRFKSIIKELQNRRTSDNFEKYHEIVETIENLNIQLRNQSGNQEQLATSIFEIEDRLSKELSKSLLNQGPETQLGYYSDNFHVKEEEAPLGCLVHSSPKSGGGDGKVQNTDVCKEEAGGGGEGISRGPDDIEELGGSVPLMTMKDVEQVQDGEGPGVELGKLLDNAENCSVIMENVFKTICGTFYANLESTGKNWIRNALAVMQLVGRRFGHILVFVNLWILGNLLVFEGIYEKPLSPSFSDFASYWFMATLFYLIAFWLWSVM